METAGVPDNGIENCWKIMGWKLLAYHGPGFLLHSIYETEKAWVQKEYGVPEMLVRNENIIFGARACCFIKETGGIASVL
jgi:hypothetical protein